MNKRFQLAGLGGATPMPGLVRIHEIYSRVEHENKDICLMTNSQGGQSTPEMEHSDLHPPPAEVRTLTGYKIPKVNPGQPRIDPRAAMRPSAAPGTPPKTFRKEEGASRKRKRENSRTPGSSEQPNPPPWREGSLRRLTGSRKGKGRGASALHSCPPRGAQTRLD